MAEEQEGKKKKTEKEKKSVRTNRTQENEMADQIPNLNINKLSKYTN